MYLSRQFKEIAYPEYRTTHGNFVVKCVKKVTKITWGWMVHNIEAS
jgi:hypothetical protein